MVDSATLSFIEAINNNKNEEKVMRLQASRETLPKFTKIKFKKKKRDPNLSINSGTSKELIN
jgi:hypothetical protein